MSRGDLRAEHLHQALGSRASQEINVKLRDLARVMTKRNDEFDGLRHDCEKR